MALRWSLAFLCLQDPAVRVRELGSDDVETRERAVRELAVLGTAAKGALEEAATSGDSEVALRARTLLRRLGPLRIAFGFDPAHGDSERPLPATLRFWGSDRAETVFYPAGLSVRIELLELRETPEPGPWSGRFGGRASTGCLLLESDFARVPAGGVHEKAEADLRGRPAEPLPAIRAANPEVDVWRVDPAGRYRILASYRFDREAYKRKCPKRCAGHDDPAKPWNLCLEGPLEAEEDFVIVRSRAPCGCGRR
jgi:hypothetical protein